MSQGLEGEAESLEYEWLSIAVSPVPWPFKDTAFHRLKGRISCWIQPSQDQGQGRVYTDLSISVYD